MPDPETAAATTAVRPLLVQASTKLLAIAGAALVTHGFATADTVATATSALAQEIAGTAIALIGVAIGAIHTVLLAHAPSIDAALSKEA